MSDQVIDEVLMQSLIVARKKPRNFALISKGAAALHLIISKKPIKDPDVLAAKKLVGGNAATIGIVSADPEVDKGLVYRVTELPTVSEKKVKQYIKEKTELNWNARFELVAALSPIDEAEGDAASTSSNSTADIESNAEPIQSTVDEENINQPPEYDPMFALKEAMKRLTPKIREFLELYPDSKSSMLDLVASFQSNVKSLDENAARQSLLSIGERLRQANSQNKPSVSVGLSDLNPLAGKIKAALLDDKYGEKVRTLVKQFKGAIEQENFDVAGEYLNALEEVLAEQENGVRDKSQESQDTIDRLTKLIPEPFLLTTPQPLLDKLLPTLANPTLGKRFGAGGFGMAYALTSEHGEPLVGKFSTLERNDQLIKDELAVYEKLAGCPGIPKCLGMQELNVQVEIPKRTKIKRKALLIEAVQGQQVGAVFTTLHDQLKNRSISDEDFWNTISFFLQSVLKTLKFFSEKALVHCDLKPENIMIDSISGEVKVIDVGGATSIGSEVTQISREYFPSNEMEKVDNLADVYCLGKTLEKLLKLGNTPKNELFEQLISDMTVKDKDMRPSVNTLLSHPLLTQTEESQKKAKETLQGSTQKPSLEHREEALLEVTPGYSKAAWDATMQNALEWGILDEKWKPKVESVSQKLEEFENLKREIDSLSLETDLKKLKEKLADFRDEWSAIQVLFRNMGAVHSRQISSYLDNWREASHWDNQLDFIAITFAEQELEEPKNGFNLFFQEKILDTTSDILKSIYKYVIDSSRELDDTAKEKIYAKRKETQKKVVELKKRQEELNSNSNLTEEEILEREEILQQLLNSERELQSLDNREQRFRVPEKDELTKEEEENDENVNENDDDDDDYRLDERSRRNAFLNVGALMGGESNSRERSTLDETVSQLKDNLAELIDRSSFDAMSGAQEGEEVAGGNESSEYAKRFQEIMELAYAGPLPFFNMSKEESEIPREFDECEDPNEKEELYRLFAAALEMASKRIFDTFHFLSDRYAGYRDIKDERNQLLEIFFSTNASRAGYEEFDKIGSKVQRNLMSHFERSLSDAETCADGDGDKGVSFLNDTCD